MRLCAWMVGLLVPCYALFFSAAAKERCTGRLGSLVLVSRVFFGQTFALLQGLVDDRMRATTLSVVMLLANLIGMGLGPQMRDGDCIFRRVCRQARRRAR